MRQWKHSTVTFDMVAMWVTLGIMIIALSALEIYVRFFPYEPPEERLERSLEERFNEMVNNDHHRSL